MRTNVQLRRDTFKNWWESDPLLSCGEIVVIFRGSQEDEGVIDASSKCIGYAIGDGMHRFRDLDIFVNNTVTQTSGDIDLGEKVVDCYTVTDSSVSYKQLTGQVTVEKNDYLFASAGIGGGTSGGPSKNYFKSLYLVTDSQYATAGDIEDYSEIESSGYGIKLTADDNSECVIVARNQELAINNNVDISATLKADKIVSEGDVELKKTLSVYNGSSTTKKVTISGTNLNVQFVNGSQTGKLYFSSNHIYSSVDLYRE